MKNHKSFIAMFCLLTMLSGTTLRSAEVSQSSQSYWGWFKQGAQAIYNNISLIWKVPYAVKSMFNIPVPRLVEKNELTLDQKRLTEFRYDISRDNEIVKNLRKQLGLSGIYIADGSSKDLHKKVLLTKPIGQEYIERGFNVENDNSLSKCLSKLLVVIKKNGLVLSGQSPEQDACVQLLWEIENSLPNNLKTDTTDKQFIEFAHRMYPDITNNSIIASYLLFWSYYTMLFRKDKGLLNAIKKLDESIV